MNYQNSSGCIQTYSGHMYSVRDPDPETIEINDIAVALARTPRFGGHTTHTYNVALHSDWVYEYVSERTDDPEIHLAALLHDAHEAYLGDVPKPIKPMIPGFDVLEEVNQAAMAYRFRFDQKLFHHPLVKEADLVALATERRDLMGPCNGEWSMDLPAPAPDTCIIYYSELASGRIFMNSFNEIQLRRNAPVTA